MPPPCCPHNKTPAVPLRVECLPRAGSECVVRPAPCWPAGAQYCLLSTCAYAPSDPAAALRSREARSSRWRRQQQLIRHVSSRCSSWMLVDRVRASPSSPTPPGHWLPRARAAAKLCGIGFGLASTTAGREAPGLAVGATGADPAAGQLSAARPGGNTTPQATLPIGPRPPSMLNSMRRF